MRTVASVVAVIVCCAVGEAAAEPVEKTSEPTKVEMFVSANPPLGWIARTSFAASVGWGWGRQALRFNGAYYDGLGIPYRTAEALFQYDDSRSLSGGTTDLGIGWMFFPRRLWDGPSLELGALARFRDTHETGIDSSVEDIDTKTIAGRGLVGWSWLFGDHVFLSAAVGLSVGNERGTHRIESEFEPMQLDDLDHVKVAAEGFVRFGVAWELKRKKTN